MYVKMVGKVHIGKYHVSLKQIQSNITGLECEQWVCPSVKGLETVETGMMA